MWIEMVEFVMDSLLIVIVAKYVLVKLLRKLAESLNLSSKTVGNITGVATSIPEFLTVSFSAGAGLLSTSIYNILSSNIINLVQYLLSIFWAKNQRVLRNKALQVDFILVLFTILIPSVMLWLQIEFSMNILPILLFCLILFYYISNNAHQLYLKEQLKEMEEEIQKEAKWIKGKTSIVIKYSVYLLFTSVALYIIGNRLSIVLENLADVFYIPEGILGILLGVITSIPELITFFEAQKHYKKTDNRELGVIEATNNLLTSNILNLFVIQSIGILIYEFVTKEPNGYSVLASKKVEWKNAIFYLKYRFLA